MKPNLRHSLHGLSVLLTLAAGPAWADKPPPPPCSLDSIDISPNNKTADEGANVQLNGQVKTTNADTVTYTWESSGPQPLNVSGDTTTHLSFTAPPVDVGGAAMVWKFTVTACGTSKFATANVNVANLNGPPVAVATVTPSSVNEGGSFTLDGTGSHDPDLDSLTYLWEQVDNLGFAVSGLPSTSVKPTLSAPTGVPYPGGITITFRLTVRDPSNLTSTTTQGLTVKWVNEAPVAKAAVELDGASSACVTGQPTVTVDENASFMLQGNASTDDEDGIANYAWSMTSGGPVVDLPGASAVSSVMVTAPTLTKGNGDTMTFRVKVTDTLGLASYSDECTVKVHDVTPPTVRVPATITEEATSANGATVAFPTNPSAELGASDNVDGELTPTCTPVSGSTFKLGDTTVTCTATDAAGNQGSNSFTVTVRDTTPPTVTVPTEMMVEATSANGAPASFTTSATDIVDGTAEPVTCSPASGSTFVLGKTLVTCKAKDKSGNEGSGTFYVTVRDTTPPVVTVPSDINAEATSALGASVTFTVSATDLVDGPDTPTCSPASGSTFELDKTVTVSCTATDKTGNASNEKTFTVRVEDHTPPTLTVSSDITAEATGQSGAFVAYTATANDLVDGSVTPTCLPSSGSVFPLGTTTVTCDAMDTRGNKADTAVFHVTVQDTTPPTVTVPANITTGPTGHDGSTVTFTASATDIVDGSVVPTCTPASGSKFAAGTTTTVTCSATDQHGNAGSNSFSVTVNQFTFVGFFQPIDNLPNINTVKNGPTVPVKWKLQGQGGADIKDVRGVSGFKAWPINCSDVAAAAEAPIEVTATGGTSLRYDLTALQYVFNWQTPKTSGACYRLDVSFVDGQTKNAFFKLK